MLSWRFHIGMLRVVSTIATATDALVAATSVPNDAEYSLLMLQDGLCLCVCVGGGA